MDDKPRAGWEPVNEDWRGRAHTVAGMGRRHGLPAAAIVEHAMRTKWPARPGSVDRLMLIGRLLGVLELQIEHLEKVEMTKNGETEAAVLGKLTASLGKLITLANAEARGTAAEGETAEMRDIRNRLAERINALTKK